MPVAHIKFGSIFLCRFHVALLKYHRHWRIGFRLFSYFIFYWSRDIRPLAIQKRLDCLCRHLFATLDTFFDECFGVFFSRSCLVRKEKYSNILDTTTWIHRMKMHITFDSGIHIIYFLDSKTQKNHYICRHHAETRILNENRRKPNVQHQHIHFHWWCRYGQAWNPKMPNIESSCRAVTATTTTIVWSI